MATDWVEEDRITTSTFTIRLDPEARTVTTTFETAKGDATVSFEMPVGEAAQFFEAGHRLLFGLTFSRPFGLAPEVPRT